MQRLEAYFPQNVAKIVLNSLTQWDKDVLLHISGGELPESFEIHIGYEGITEAYRFPLQKTDDVATVKIPNELLQQTQDIKAWIYIIDSEGCRTTKTITIPLAKREKPADFSSSIEPSQKDAVEQLIENTNKLIKEIEEGGAGGSGGVEVDPTVPAWAKQPKKPTYTADEVGAYSKSEVDLKINSINNDIGKVENQTKTIKSDVESLQQQINEEAHFKGYLSTNAKIQALEATPNDFAYSAESGTKWIYDAEKGWQDSGTPVPDQLTPASDALPLMNGTASSGTATEYARGDHRHPTDTTRVSVEEFNELKSDIEITLDYIISIQENLIGGGSV